MYNYEKQKEWLFTDEGQRRFLIVRDYTLRTLSVSGAAKMDCLITGTGCDCWRAMAFIDRMVELGELREIDQGPNTWGQDRIFVKG
jgi:hypothetical protein